MPEKLFLMSHSFSKNMEITYEADTNTCFFFDKQHFYRQQQAETDKKISNS